MPSTIHFFSCGPSLSTLSPSQSPKKKPTMSLRLPKCVWWIQFTSSTKPCSICARAPNSEVTSMPSLQRTLQIVSILEYMLDNYIQPQYQPRHLILPSEPRAGSLFLGDINAALDLQEIHASNITTVITAAEGMDHVHYPPSITHIRYPLLDAKTERISKYFEEIFHVIEEERQKGGVLVHCAAGVSRSATLVIAYLMRKNGWNFKRAIEFVRSKRSVICPNLGFEMQLKEYERSSTRRSNSTKSTVLKMEGLPGIAGGLKRQGKNLPDIQDKGKYKFLRFRRMSSVVKKPERDFFRENRLNLENNLIILPLKTDNSEIAKKDLRRQKPKSSQLLARHLFTP